MAGRCCKEQALPQSSVHWWHIVSLLPLLLQDNPVKWYQSWSDVPSVLLPVFRLAYTLRPIPAQPDRVLRPSPGVFRLWTIPSDDSHNYWMLRNTETADSFHAHRNAADSRSPGISSGQTHVERYDWFHGRSDDLQSISSSSVLRSIRKLRRLHTWNYRSWAGLNVLRMKPVLRVHSDKILHYFHLYWMRHDDNSFPEQAVLRSHQFLRSP